MWRPREISVKVLKRQEKEKGSGLSIWKRKRKGKGVRLIYLRLGIIVRTRALTAIRYIRLTSNVAPYPTIPAGREKLVLHKRVKSKDRRPFLMTEKGDCFEYEC